jgi:ribonuclease HI
VRCFDLSAAFYLVPLSPEVGDTMACKIAGDLFRPTRLPMGVVFAPDLMQVILMILAEPAKFPTVNIEIHIDNIRFTSASQKDLDLAVDHFKSRLVKAGVNLDALREEVPNEFLGMNISYVPTPTARVKDTTYEKMLTAAKVLASEQQVTVGDFREGVSRILYTARMLDVPLAHHYMFLKNARRRYQEIFKDQLQEDDLINAMWSCAMPDFHSLLKEIAQRQSKGVPFERRSVHQPDVVIYTDASTHGWGAVMIEGGQITEASGKWKTRMTSADIVALEAEAVQKAFELWHDDLIGKNVRLCIDSTSVKHVLRKGYSRSFETNEVLRRILPLTKDFAQVSILHVASQENAADLLSRGKQLLELTSYLGAGTAVTADTVLLFG